MLYVYTIVDILNDELLFVGDHFRTRYEPSKSYCIVSCEIFSTSYAIFAICSITLTSSSFPGCSSYMYEY